MLRIFKVIFLPAALIFFAVSFTGAYFSNNVSISGNSFSTGFSANTDIIINEFVPDPTGLDNALMPEGEWVELYNKGSWTIDVNGWSLGAGGSGIQISSLNTNTGDTTIKPNEYLVVYRNGDSGIELVNSGDIINLRLSAGGEIIDTFSYSAISENKSWSRVPNAGSAWEIKNPTKGISNGN